jgi:hypothetical protein
LIVTEEHLCALVEELKPAEPPQEAAGPAAQSRAPGVFDVEAFLQRHGVEVVKKFTKPDGTIIWQLAVCVFNPDHVATSVVVMQLPSGALVYRCSHSSCLDKHWKDFRRHFEPDYDKPKQPKGKATKSRKQPRIAKLTRPAQEITIAGWRAIIEENFPAYLKPAEVCLSVEVQLLLNDVFNPFALALVDVPSSGKTIILNFFDGLPELTYTTDNFTPAAFVSHASNVKREDLGKVDLLPRIRYRTMIFRELGSVFGAKDDDLIKSFGILTRVLDGEGLQTDSGVHGRRGYQGDYVFMFLGGTPPIAPRVFKIMGNFGSRLFFLALRTPDEDDEKLVAQNQGVERKTKEIACKNATTALLQTLWADNPSGITWNKLGDSHDCLLVIARCARLLSSLRGAINVWYDEGSEKLSHTVPVIEKPNRINCLLYNLARGHAIICGRRQLEPEDLWPILDITFDSAPTIRARLFRGLIEAGGTLTTSGVEDLLRCSSPTARKEMEALSALGVVTKASEVSLTPGHPETKITLASRFEWFTSEECQILMSWDTLPAKPFSNAKNIKKGFAGVCVSGPKKDSHNGLGEKGLSDMPLQKNEASADPDAAPKPADSTQPIPLDL